MPKFPTSCEQLPLLQSVESVRIIREDDHSAMHEVRDAARSQAALKWIHLPAGSAPDAQRMQQSRAVEELSILRALSSAPQFARVQDTALQRSPDGSMDAFVCMELLTPLADRLLGKPFTTDDAARLVSDGAEALTLCHAAGVVHGNLKPSNILYGDDHFKLSDGGATLTLLRQDQQSAFFQSPEQRAGKTPSPQWDVYGLGMTLYVLYHQGMLPFQTKPGQQAMQAAWQRISTLNKTAAIPAPKDAPAAVAEVILRAIAPAPEKRYQSPDELAASFAAAVSSLTAQERQAPLIFKETALLGSSAKPAAKTSRLPLIIAALVAVIALIAVIGLPRVFGPGEPPPVPTAVPLILSAEPELFGATLTVSNIPADADCTAYVRVSSAAKGWEADVINGTITLTELAPQTTYTVTVSAGEQSGETTLTTLSPTQRHFQSAFTALYTTTYLSMLRDLGASELSASYPNRLTILPQSMLTLQEPPLSAQDLALLLLWRADVLETPTEFSRPYYLVLRAHGDAFVLAEPVVTPSNTCTHDVTTLLDACYERYGQHDFSAPVRMEVYWLDELVGAAELTLIAAP